MLLADNRPHSTATVQDGLKHPWIVTAAAPDPEKGREKTVEADEEPDRKGGMSGPVGT